MRDTGMGIRPADLPRVFERFYRAGSARGRDPGGTELGLSIAEWIAEQHGGAIALASQPGRGTNATVRLPLASPDAHDQDAILRNRSGFPQDSLSGTA
jgi:signal transduction histidine kinase